jgi:hypothetical protein
MSKEKSDDKPKPTKLKVRALRTGYFEHIRRHENDVFVIRSKDGYIKTGTGKLIPKHFSAKDQFSESWMEIVDEATPEKVTGAQAALSSASNDIKAMRQPASSESVI